MKRIIALVASFVAVLVAAAGGQAAAPVWGKIGGIGVGMLQDAVTYHFGLGVRDSCSDKGCVDLRYYGPVQVLFGRAGVTSVDCAAPGSLAGRGCPPGFALPDGVRLRTPVPYAKQWRGYVRSPGGQYDFFSWKKQVLVGGGLVVVYLTVEKGNVIGIVESALKSDA